WRSSRTSRTAIPASPARSAPSSSPSSLAPCCCCARWSAATAWPSSSRENDVVRKETFMRRLLLLLLAGVLALPLAAPPADTAEDRLVVYTAYEENELKTFWEQFKKDLPDLAAKASYIRGSTGPTIARLEAEKANPQADVVWGVFNDYMTGAASKGLLEPYAAREASAIPARFGEDRMWQYYDALDKNLSQVTKSGGAPGRMAASGETPIGVALAYEVEVAKKQGAPIDVIWPSDGVPWTFEANGLVKGAKNPMNARRFLDWAVAKSAMASYAEWRGTGITRSDVPVSGPKITEMKLIDLDFVKAGDPQYKERLVKRWQEKYSK